MARVIVDLSVSLDGFVAGADDGPRFPLGRGGEALFAWMAAGEAREGIDPRLRVPKASQVVVDEWLATTGAMVMGRRTFDIAGGWADGHPIAGAAAGPEPRVSPRRGGGRSRCPRRRAPGRPR